MLKRLARVLCACHYARLLGEPIDDPSVQMLVEAHWRQFLDDTGFVLVTLREASAAMLASTTRIAVGWSDDPAELTTSEADLIWQTMVDAATRS